MLISFTVGNYRSFRGEQTLHLLASKRLGSGRLDRCTKLPGVDEHALRVAALYGANGAGKSNLVTALELVQRLVISGTSLSMRIPFDPFQFADTSPPQPTSYELRFFSGGSIFTYGFCCDARHVLEEWLDLHEGKKQRQLFARSTNADGKVEVELGTGRGAEMGAKIRALAQVGARANQLFLTEIVNLDDPEAQGPHLRAVVDWFRHTLAIIQPDASFVGLAEAIAADETFAQFAGEFLNGASTGVSNLEVKTEEIPRSDLPSGLRDIQPEGGPEGERYLLAPDGDLMIMDPKKELIQVRKIAALHATEDGGRSSLALNQESDGTQRLLNLLPALHRLRSESAVFVIDELERSMHPILAHKYVEFFQKALKGQAGQMIFTTHETTLLDLDLIRRDGIWFTEKDKGGATHLYSLSDFKVRRDLRVAKGYLQGRFGAVPFLGGIDRLIETEAAEQGQR